MPDKAEPEFLARIRDPKTEDTGKSIKLQNECISDGTAHPKK